MRRPFLPLLAVLALLGLATCEEGPPPEWNSYAGLAFSTTPDVTIVDNDSDGWSDDERWTVSPEPAIRIGITEGGPEYQFFSIAGVLRLRDGRVIIADEGSKQLRYFSAAGEHITSVGGTGQGPGEFQSIAWMKPLLQDSVILWDFNLSRGSVFTANGEFIRSVGLPSVPSHPVLYPENVFPDGNLLAQAGPPRDEVDVEGRQWKVVAAYQITPAASEISAFLLGEFPSQLVQSAPTVWAKWQVAGDKLVYSRGDVPEILLFDLRSNAVRVLRRPAAEIAEANAVVRPYYDALHSDEAGNIWAHMYDTEWWNVFDRAGQWLGDVSISKELEVYQIAHGHIAGVERTDLGVEQAVVYQLIIPD